MSVLPAFMYANHMRAWYPQRSKEGIGSPRTIVMDAVSRHMGAESRSSARASALNHCAISPAQKK